MVWGRFGQGSLQVPGAGGHLAELGDREGIGFGGSQRVETPVIKRGAVLVPAGGAGEVRKLPDVGNDRIYAPTRADDRGVQVAVLGDARCRIGLPQPGLGGQFACDVPPLTAENDPGLDAVDGVRARKPTGRNPIPPGAVRMWRWRAGWISYGCAS